MHSSFPDLSWSSIDWSIDRTGIVMTSSPALEDCKLQLEESCRKGHLEKLQGILDANPSLLNEVREPFVFFQFDSWVHSIKWSLWIHLVWLLCISLPRKDFSIARDIYYLCLLSMWTPKIERKIPLFTYAEWNQSKIWLLCFSFTQISTLIRLIRYQSLSREVFLVLSSLV